MKKKKINESSLNSNMSFQNHYNIESQNVDYKAFVLLCNVLFPIYAKIGTNQFGMHFRDNATYQRAG